MRMVLRSVLLTTDTLHMEQCKGEQPVYKLLPMPTKTLTADIVISLPECDGMDMEFLFDQPSHGEYLEDISYEFDIDY